MIRRVRLMVSARCSVAKVAAVLFSVGQWAILSSAYGQRPGWYITYPPEGSVIRCDPTLVDSVGGQLRIRLANLHLTIGDSTWSIDLVSGGRHIVCGDLSAWDSAGGPVQTLCSFGNQQFKAGALYLDPDAFGTLRDSNQWWIKLYYGSGGGGGLRNIGRQSRMALDILGVTRAALGVRFDFTRPRLVIDSIPGAIFDEDSLKFWLSRRELVVYGRAWDDTSGSGAIDSVLLYVDGKLSNKTTTTQDSSFALSHVLNEGIHAVRVVARDMALCPQRPDSGTTLLRHKGWTANSNIFTVIVDTTPPISRLRSLYRGGWTNRECIPVEVENISDDVLYVSLAYDSCRSDSKIVTPLPDSFCFRGEGIYRFQAIAVDSALNREQFGNWEDSVGYDATRPVVAGWPEQDGVLRVDTLVVQVILRDSVPPSVCEVSGLDSAWVWGWKEGTADTQVVWEESLGGETSRGLNVSIRKPPEGDGRWQYQMVVRDRAGNETKTDVWRITWDQTPPVVNLLVPDSTSECEWAVAVEVLDALSGIDTVRVDTSRKPAGPWGRWFGAEDLGCPNSWSDSRKAPPEWCRDGVSYYRIRGVDCAGNEWQIVDSTVFRSIPGISLVLKDTTSEESAKEIPASPGYTNDCAVLSTVTLDSAPKDPSAYLAFRGNKVVVASWRNPDSVKQQDTLDLRGLFENCTDGTYTVSVRLIRPAFGDSSVEVQSTIILDLKPPRGYAFCHDPDSTTNDCTIGPYPFIGWTDDPAIRVRWDSLSSDVWKTFPPRDSVVPVNSEGHKLLSAVLGKIPFVADSAGNKWETDASFVFDSTSVGWDDHDSWLEDPTSGSRKYVNDDTLVAVIAWKRKPVDPNFGTVGVHRVAYRFDTTGEELTCEDFDPSKNPFVFDVGPTDTGRFDLSIPESFRKHGQRIVLKHAFIDSTGDLSATFLDTIQYIGIRMQVMLYDPTPDSCQDVTAWTNDRDSIGICVNADSSWRVIDSLRIDFGWTSRSPDAEIPRPDRTCFAVQLPEEMPVECESGSVWVTGVDVETGATSSAGNNIYFDFSSPELRFTVADADTGRRPEEWKAQPGWTNNEAVQVQVSFQDNCVTRPSGYELQGDWANPVRRCSGDAVWIDSLAEGEGGKLLKLAAYDSAGNVSASAEDRIILDKTRPDMAFVDSIVYENDGEITFRVKAKDDHGEISGFCFTADRLRWDCLIAVSGNGRNGIDTTISVQESCVHAPRDSLQYWLYGVSIDKGGNGSAMDSVLVRRRQGFVEIRIYDWRDPQDSTYVNSIVETSADTCWDSLSVKLRWAGAESIRVEHSYRDTTLRDISFSGRTQFPWMIRTRRNSTYLDTIYALRYVGGGSVDTAKWTFVVDHLPPALQRVEFVDDCASPRRIPYASTNSVLLRVAARDEADASTGVSGRLERWEAKLAWVGAAKVTSSYYLEPRYETPLDSLTENGQKVWYKCFSFELPADSTGWWRAKAWVWDAAGNAESLESEPLEYRPEGASAFCYPNPFRPAVDDKVCLSVYTDAAGPAEVAIYDAFGFLVRRWTAPGLRAGVNDGCDPVEGLTWDGRNGAGDLVSSGGYICRIRTPDGKEHTIKIGVLR